MLPMPNLWTNMCVEKWTVLPLSYASTLTTIRDPSSRQPSPTTLHMSARMCKVQEPLNATIAVLVNPAECLTTEEWEALTEIAVVLTPFDAVTREISTVKAVTASKIIMLARCLITACNKIQPTLRTELFKQTAHKAAGGNAETFWCSGEQHAYGTCNVS